MDAYYGLGIIEPSDAVVVGNLAARVKDQNHGANGVATSTSTGGAACFLTAQSHHRYPQVVHRTLKLVTIKEPQMESPCVENLNPEIDYMWDWIPVSDSCDYRKAALTSPFVEL